MSYLPKRANRAFVNQSGILVLMLATITVAVMLSFVPTVAYAEQYQGYYYGITSNNEVCIYDYEGPETEIRIPATIEGYPVAEIGIEAFMGNTAITKVVVPDSVRLIDYCAFSGCTNLRSIELGAGLEELGSHAFGDAVALTELKFNCKDVAIPYCGVLENAGSASGGVVFRAGSSCEKIPAGLSIYDVNFKKVVISDSVREIGDRAFSFCPQLTSVSFGASVATIGERAFAACDKLKSVAIPSAVTKIGADAFWGLEKVYYSRKSQEGLLYPQGMSLADALNGVRYVYRPYSIGEYQIKTDASCLYSGERQTPRVQVSLPSVTLKLGTDYTVSYANNKLPGLGRVTVTGKGAYAGTKTATFKILPKGTSVKKLAKARRGFTVKWKKQAKQVDGYRVQWSTDKKFKKGVKSKTVKLKSSAGKKCSLKVSKLKGGKKYYVRVCTYKTVKANGKTAKYYSPWSKVKSVTTKK